MENSSIHTTLQTATANINTYVALLIITPVAIVTFILNLVSLIILRKSKKLRENKFHLLAICLSATNIASSIGCCVLITNTVINICGFQVPYICYSSTLITALTVTCSLLQILFICVERLVATFSLPTNNIWRRKLNVFIVTSLLAAISYIIFIFAIYGNTTSTSCRAIDLFNENYGKFLSVTSSVRLALYILIVTIYIIILFRLRKIANQVLPLNAIEVESASQLTSNPKINTGNSDKHTSVANPSSRMLSAFNSSTIRSTDSSQSSGCSKPRTQISMSNIRVIQVSAYNIPQSSTQETSNHRAVTTSQNYGSANRMLRFKKTMFTLGSIIALVLLTGFPSVILNLIFSADVTLVSPMILEFTNILILINPLSDPIIYVFRIDEFRRILRCQTHP